MTQVRCIYKVPSSLREVKPAAYEPRRVIIGLFNRSAIPTAATGGAGTSSNPAGQNNMGNYMHMEERKKTYLASFTNRFGEGAIERMKKTIEEEGSDIRGSYYDSTGWVSPEVFVDHILKDSIFIMEFIMNNLQNIPDISDAAEDRNYFKEVKEDLILFENQLPYFIFEKLFGPVMKQWRMNETVEQCILKFFDLKITNSTTFMHFTDMFRYVYEESLEQTPELNDLRVPALTKMENAAKLSRSGVDFKRINQRTPAEIRELHRRFDQLPSHTTPMRSGTDDYSLRVAFIDGFLKMPSFHANEDNDRVLRNVIAYEQRHPAVRPYTSNYIHFINFLITTEEDVDVLSAKGVLRNGMGRPSLVVEMVNMLSRGVDISASSNYHIIAIELSNHCNSRRKKTWATLKSVYFSDLWRGTATIAAILIVLLTLVGTVASVIQAIKSFDGKQKTPGGR